MYNFLDKSISILLALAITSAFFIFPNLHIGNIALPQLFYFFFFVACIIILLKLIYYSTYRKVFLLAINRIRTYYILFALLISFILLNFIYSSYNGIFISIETKIDVLRIVVMLFFFLIVIVHIILCGRKILTPLLASLYISVTLFPLFIIRDITLVRSYFPLFFDGPKIQAFQYNPTSLATWLIVSFGMITSTFFILKYSVIKKIFLLISCTLMMGLIWWSESRGAIVGGVIITISLLIFVILKLKAKIWTTLPLALCIIIVSLFLLPDQTKKHLEYRFFTHGLQNYSSVLQFNLLSGQKREISSHAYINLISSNPISSNITLQNQMKIARYDTKKYGDGSHSTLFQAANLGGWGAMFVMVVFFTKISFAMYRLIKNSNDPIALGISSAFFGTFILLMLNDFLQLKTLWIVSAIIVAYDILLQNKANEISRSQ